MAQHFLGVLIGVAALAGWFGLYGLALLLTRPARPQPLPATQDLGPNPEPPAVVSLLANYWELTEDAGEATLLDLGARKILEFRQPGNDARQTTVHVRVANPTGLTPYEQRVFDRVAGIAVGNVVPLTALTFRDQAAATGFEKRLRAEVIADARERGLSRRRLSKPLVSALSVAGAVVGAALALAVVIGADMRHTDPRAPLGTWLISWAVLSSIAGRNHGERDTVAGREVAARWLGVKTWLRNTEAFGDLPPAAVAVWDRYLAYGAAVGATRVSSAVIDLGMGNRRKVWSSFGGTWHPVRVRYPSFWPRYGKPAPPVILRGVLAGFVGVLLLRYGAGFVGDRLTGTGLSRAADPVRLAGLGLGLVLTGFGLYLVVRMAIDLAAPASITGQVLWTQVWRSTSGGENSPAVPVTYYLAIDDGTAERTTAWALPRELAGRCADGDTVTITVRRWTRRIGAVTMVQAGTLRKVEQAEVTTDKTENLIAAAMGVPVPGATGNGGADPRVPLAGLLTAEEVSRALGFAVRAGGPATPPRPGEPARLPEGPVVVFVDGTGQPALVLMATYGLVASMALRSRRHSTPLPGIGEEAYTGEGWAVGRSGHTVLVLQLQGAGRSANPSHVYWLLATAVGRLASPVRPAG